MFRNEFGYAVAIVAVSLPVHYLGGLDWPWAIVVGAITSVAVRSVFTSGIVARRRKRLLPGGR